MRTVEDEDGNSYLLLKRSGEEWLVADPDTGRETYRRADTLEPVEDGSPLAVTARAVPDSVRSVVTAVRTEQSLGLLVALDRRGPLSVRSMLDRFEFCESDLHGQLAEFRAAGLIEEQRVAGERGYAATDSAGEAIATLTRD